MPLFHSLTIFLIIYSVVNIYILSHFWHVRGRYLHYIVFRILLMVTLFLLPLHLVLERVFNISFLPLKYPGYLYLAFIVYCALYLLVMDLVRLLFRLIGVFPFFAKHYVRVLNAGLAFAFIVCCAGAFMGTLIHQQNYSITIDKKSSHFDHVKIVLIADLHLSDMTGSDFVKRVAERINSLDADLVLIPGDILDRGTDHLRFDYAHDFRQLKTNYGIYSVTGNHEYYGDMVKTRAFLDKAGIHLIEDSSVVIDNGLVIVGRNDRNVTGEAGRKPLFSLMESVDKALPVILMDHSPFNLEQAAENNIALQLSGHTHHGQLFPINILTSMIYQKSRGYLRIGNTQYIVTSGLGFWGPMIRTSALPEIVVIDVNFR
jgi:predicted MPP superfamily phosphohydrolase